MQKIKKSKVTCSRSRHLQQWDDIQSNAQWGILSRYSPGSMKEQLNPVPCADANSLSVHHVAVLRNTLPLEPAEPESKSLNPHYMVITWESLGQYFNHPESRFPHTQKWDTIPFFIIARSTIFLHIF